MHFVYCIVLLENLYKIRRIFASQNSRGYTTLVMQQERVGFLDTFIIQIVKRMIYACMYLLLEEYAYLHFPDIMSCELIVRKNKLNKKIK